VNGTALSHGLEVICGLGKYASRFLRAVNTPATVHHHGTFGVVARRRQRANRADGAYYARRCHVRRAGCAVYGLAVRVLRRRQGQLQAMMRDVVTEGTAAGIGFGPDVYAKTGTADVQGQEHDLITVPLQGEQFTRRPIRHVQAQGLAIEEHERFKLGITERLAARKRD
jgi:hypothetical protein